MNDPTKRFSSRVADYRLYRPDYPAGVFWALASRIPPSDGVAMADIGSGTGIFTRQLLETGYRVTAVEPNGDMARVAEEELSGNPRFTQVHAPAEELPFPDATLDLITVAQAFHWFDPVAARREFLRVLKPAGLVALVWNDRLKSGSRFAEGYEALLQRHATDYAKVDPNRTSGEKMDLFWAAADREAITMPHAQHLDRAALRGRVDSSSYVPLAGTREHRAMHEELDGLFDGCAVEGRVAFEYVTCLFLGRPSVQINGMETVET